MSQLNGKITIENTRQEPAEQAFKENKVLAPKESMTSVERSTQDLISLSTECTRLE